MSPTRALMLMALSACAAGAFAQTVSPTPGAGLDPETQLAVDEWKREGPVGFQFYAQGSYDFDADLDTTGESAVSRFGAGAGVEIEAAENFVLRFTFDAEWSDYDFDGVTGLIGADPSPWEDLQSYRFAPSVTIGLDERWHLIIGGDLEVAYEPGADIGDALTGNGYVAARHQWTEDFALTFGVTAESRIEDDAVVLPILGVEWNINEKLRFATRGVGAGLTYRLSDQFDVTLRGSYDPRSYRLSEDRGANPDGVVNDERVLAGVELTWRPAPFAIVSLYAGAVLWQEYEVLNSSGGKLTDNESDAAPFIAARATIRF